MGHFLIRLLHQLRVGSPQVEEHFGIVREQIIGVLQHPGSLLPVPRFLVRDAQIDVGAKLVYLKEIAYQRSNGFLVLIVAA